VEDILDQFTVSTDQIKHPSISCQLEIGAAKFGLKISRLLLLERNITALTFPMDAGHLLDLVRSSSLEE